MSPASSSAPMRLVARPLTAPDLTLELVVPATRIELQAALDVDPESWSIQFVSGRGDAFAGYWDAMLDQVERGERIAYAARLPDGRLVGTSSFHHISAQNRTVEIGSTFFRPEVRGGVVNPAAKLMMMDHAFGCGALRVQLTVDSRNQRSLAAVTKLGAVREGMLRKHLVTWTGHNRDTVVFSVLDVEWPQVRERLIQRRARLAINPSPL